MEVKTYIEKSKENMINLLCNLASKENNIIVKVLKDRMSIAEKNKNMTDAAIVDASNELTRIPEG